MDRLKPRVIKSGYINQYSELSSQELRQIRYKTLYKNQNKEWDESMVFLTKAFSKIKDKPLTVLDAGCGNGNYVIDENQEHIETTIGIDVKTEFTQKNISMDKIIYSSLESIPLNSNSFDVVISLWVLEHLINPAQVFKEIHRVLKPGGIFMFVTTNRNYLPIKIINLLKSNSINHIINKSIFGRNEQDIFKTYYRTNCIEDIQKHAKGLYDIENLFYNYDPSYTSFDIFSFYASNTIDKLLKSKFTKAHLIGILRKII